MRYPTPERWTDQLWRTTLTLVATAISLTIAWSMIWPLLPLLVIGAGMTIIVRVAIGIARRRRDEW